MAGRKDLAGGRILNWYSIGSRCQSDHHKEGTRLLFRLSRYFLASYPEGKGRDGHFIRCNVM